MSTAIYIRVSTELQGNEGHSLDYQLAKAKAYCELHNLSPDTATVFKDIKSGTNLNRPQLQKLIANKDKFDHLVILKIDRLTRSGRDFYILKDELIKDGGLTLHSVEDHINTSSPMGKMMINMLLTFSEFEIDTLKARTVSALSAKKSKGEPMGRAPYGYEYMDKKLVKCASEQKIIARMKRLKKTGMTLAQIQAKLVAENKLSRKGQHFTIPMIHKLTGNTKKPKTRA